MSFNFNSWFNSWNLTFVFSRQSVCEVPRRNIFPIWSPPWCLEVEFSVRFLREKAGKNIYKIDRVLPPYVTRDSRSVLRSDESVHRVYLFRLNSMNPTRIVLFSYDPLEWGHSCSTTSLFKTSVLQFYYPTPHFYELYAFHWYTTTKFSLCLCKWIKEKSRNEPTSTYHIQKRLFSGLWTSQNTTTKLKE